VYFDKHQEGKYGLVRSHDLETWEDVSDRVSILDDARHGTILTVPRAGIERLLQNSLTAATVQFMVAHQTMPGRHRLDSGSWITAGRAFFAVEQKRADAT
jgi:hypothetical protein